MNVLLWTILTLGAADLDQPHTWTAITGHTLKAYFVEMAYDPASRDQKVRLREASGKQRSIPYRLLAPESQVAENCCQTPVVPGA